MAIYTSYFGNIKNLPGDVVAISIAGKCPEWYNGLEFKTLAPKYKFFMEWKQNKDNDFYVKHFNEEVLLPLSADITVDKLYRLSKRKDIVLLCYEKPGTFCHRYIVSDWLCDNGYYVTEYGLSKEMKVKWVI